MHLVSTNASARFTSSSTHQPRSWSKAEAPSNIKFMSVTPEVSHALMSSLKDDGSLNKYDMSVTPEVSHVEMWPYVASAAVASESHAVTARLIFQLTMTLPALGTSQSLSLAN